MNPTRRSGPQASPGSWPGDGADGPDGIAVVGCGHVGLVLAAGFAELGHRVVGLDIDVATVERLRSGEVSFFEPGLQELVTRNLASGRLIFTSSYTEALADAAYVFLCVSTPSTVSGAADLTNVRVAAGQIAAELAVSGHSPLIINKSTSPIGTGETIDAILARTLRETDGRPRIAANPEFFGEGRAIYDFFHPSRIVVGADNRDDAVAVAALYAKIDAPVILTDIRVAEMIKYVSNGFLATRVSFVNEIARLCEQLDIDVDGVIEGAALDPRIGRDFFTPGIGYGGSCLPKDVAALCHTGESVGVTMRVLSSVQDANVGQRKHAVNSIRRGLGSLEGKVIAVWGVTFKGGSDDLRDSPALDVVRLLRNEGARVRAFDPSMPAERFTELVDDVCGSAVEACRGADALALLTDWAEFAKVNLQAVRAALAGRFVYDGRNMLSRTDVQAVGLVYHGVGRPTTAPAAVPVGQNG